MNYIIKLLNKDHSLFVQRLLEERFPRHYDGFIESNVTHNAPHYVRFNDKKVISGGQKSTYLANNKFPDHKKVSTDWLIKFCEIKPKEVKLNSEYTAKVYSDRVEVGCQTFTKEVILELAKALG